MTYIHLLDFKQDMETFSSKFNLIRKFETYKCYGFANSILKLRFLIVIS